MPTTRKTTAAKPAAKKATPARKAAPKAKTTPKVEQLKKSAEQEHNGLSPAQRKALGKRIIALREQGVKWDGEGGICEQVGIKTALVGRALIREAGKGDELIKPLTGMRAK
jgi:hypothetical protein